MPKRLRSASKRLQSASESAVAELLQSPEPSVRWKARVGALGEDPSSRASRALREEVRSSPRVQALLAHRDRSGRFVAGRGVYAKRQGAHWVLSALADLGYPEHDESLAPVREQILDTWLAPEFYEEFEAERKADAYKRRGVPIMQSRYRRCASQQGNALFYLLRLGLENARTENLVERLLHWRWPDGGWNCDKEPSAAKSTFIHTIHSLRGLHLFGTRFRKRAALTAAREASEILLTRKLYKRRSDGKVMREEFTRLHYPLYWHYDVLFGLKVMAEIGRIHDPRCADALDWLESKRLPSGGWPAQSRYYSVSSAIELNADWVDWGGTSNVRMNPWVTADALTVLRLAGRWKP
jgi:hypothetical protein